MAYLILAYPVLVHLAVVLEWPWLAGVALVALAASFLYPPLAARRPLAWAALLAVAVGSAVVVGYGMTLYALYLPPILLPLAMLWWWSGTLREGRVPFVTRVATAIRGPLPAEYAAYTRRVTQAWVGVFGLLAAAGLGFALFAPPALWSLFTNFIAAGIIAAMFAVEYAYRRWRFRHLDHPGFVHFMRLVAKHGGRGRPA